MNSHPRQLIAFVSGLRWDRLLLLLLSFSAFALRLFHLDAQSFWYDEGFSAWLSAQPLDQITMRTAADIHPPLYYYLLHFWMMAAGESEFALRFLSLVPGVLLVAVMFLLGRRIVDETTGWIAAILTCVSPMYIWYSQEARMYMLVTLLTAVSAYFLWRLTEQPRRAYWLAMTACNVVAVYVHFYGFFIVAFEAAFFLAWWIRQETRWGLLLAGIASPALVGAAYLPWARFVFDRLNSDQSFFEGTLPLEEVVRKTLMLFTVGLSMVESDALLPTAAFALLALFGWLAIGTLRREPARPRDDNPFSATMAAKAASRLFLLFYVLMPFVLLYVVSYARPKFDPRYLMIASPPFVVLLSAGLAVLVLSFWRSSTSGVRRRLVSVALVGAAAALVLSVSISAVYNLYFDPRFSKDDFRDVASVIKANRNGDEPTLLVSGHMFPVYSYYDPTGHLIPLPDEVTLSTQRLLGYNVADDMNTALKGKSGVWLVLWQNDIVDPGNFVTTILDTQAVRLPQSRSFWGVQLLHYQLQPGTVFSDKPQIQHPLAVNFGNQIELLGFNLPAAAPSADKGLNVTVYWRSLGDLKSDYQVALQARDADGHPVGKLDSRPATYNYPTTRWKQGDILFGNFVIPLDPGTPPGAYQVEVNVYSIDDLQGLNVIDEAGNPAGQSALLKDIRVERASVPPAPDKVKPQHALRFIFTNTLEMIGFDLDRDSAEPGEAINVSVWWRALGTPRDDLRLRLELPRGQSQDNNPPGGESLPLVPGFPTTAWKSGDVILGRYTYYIPADSFAGDRPFRLSLIDSSNRRLSAPVALGTLHILPSSRVFAPPTPRIVDGRGFGGLFQLYGYDVLPTPALRSSSSGVTTISAGDSLRLTLYWHALQRTTASYNVFVHLLRQDQTILSQKDASPVNGSRPTATWLPGEYISDSYDLVIPPGTLAGPYTIEVGFFDPRTGERLTAQGGPSTSSPLTSAVLGVQVAVR